MPQKSCEIETTNPTRERKTRLSTTTTDIFTNKNKVYYKDLNDISKTINNLKTAQSWIKSISQGSKIIFKKMKESFLTPYIRGGSRIFNTLGEILFEFRTHGV